MAVITPNKEDLEFIKFEPTQTQQIAKARFWETMKNSPVLEPKDISIDHIIELTGFSALRNWARKPEFRAWFFNVNSAKHKIQAAAEGAVDALVEVMNKTDAKTASARVKAAEIVLRLGGYEPPKVRKIEVSDKDIQNMDAEQLQSYIDNTMKRLGYTRKLLDGKKVLDKEG